MEIKKYNRQFRWLVLIVIIVHVLYSNLYDLIIPGNTIVSITEEYRNFFIPAGYTYLIWIVVHAALLIYGVYQLLPSQKDNMLFNIVSLPLMISVTLNIWWGVTFHLELLTASMIILLLALTAAFMAYKPVHNALLDKEVSKWILVPFSLYTAWLIASCFINLTVWLVFMKTSGSVLGEINLARILILGIMGVAVVLGYIYWDYVIPLVIAWLEIGIYIANKDNYTPVGLAAFFCGVVLLLWSGIIFYVKKNPRTDAQIR